MERAVLLRSLDAKAARQRHPTSFSDLFMESITDHTDKEGVVMLLMVSLR